jgi:hypothetical protein
VLVASDPLQLSQSVVLCRLVLKYTQVIIFELAVYLRKSWLTNDATELALTRPRAPVVQLRDLQSTPSVQVAVRRLGSSIATRV